MLSARPSISGLPSFAFVCPSNWGFGTRTEMIAVIPSRTSSPEGGVRSLTSPSRRANWFTARVSALLKPERCVPPASVRMLFTNEKRVSL